MKVLSFMALVLGMVLAGAAVYMYFNGHFAAITMYAITGSGLFFFSYALMVLLRLFKPYDHTKNAGVSGASSYSPPSY